MRDLLQIYVLAKGLLISNTKGTTYSIISVILIEFFLFTRGSYNEHCKTLFLVFDEVKMTI